MLAVGFFSGKVAGLSAEQSLGTVAIPTVWLLLIAPAFVLCSKPSLYISELRVRFLMQCTERLGKLVTHPLFLFQRRERSLVEEFPLSAEQGQYLWKDSVWDLLLAIW